jgi:hypothetical protein
MSLIDLDGQENIKILFHVAFDQGKPSLQFFVGCKCDYNTNTWAANN